MIRGFGKRGQITIFIIIAIVVVALVVLIFLLRGNLGLGTNKIPKDVAPIKNYIDNCLEESGEKTLIVLGKKGGYRYPLFVSYSGATYYLYNGVNYFPTKEVLESEIEDYFKVNFHACLDYFSSFKEYEIEYDNINPEFSMLEESVLFDVDFPVSIKKINSKDTYTLNNFRVEIPIRLNIMYELIFKFIKSQEKIPHRFCVTCFSNTLVNEKISLNITSDRNNTLVFVLSDDKNILGNKSFEWIFANKY